MRRIHPLAILTLAATLLVLSFAVMASPAAAADPCDGSIPPDYCFETHIETAPQTLTVQNLGSPTVTSSPVGISCGATCSHNYNATRECDYHSIDCSDWVYPEVTLTSVQAAGYMAVWSANCSNQSGACGVTVEGSTTVTVSSVDAQAPTPPTLTAPLLVSGSTALTASGSTDNSGSVASYRWRVDGVDYLPGPSFTLGSSLPDGPHTVGVAARDAAGNQSAYTSKAITLDNTPPSITISSGPAQGSSIDTTAASFGFSVTDPHIDGVECALDAAAAAACTTPFNVSGLTLGAHSITISADDTVGNSASLVRNFTVVAPGTGTPPGNGETPGGGQSPPPGGSTLQPSAAVVAASWKVKNKKTKVSKFTVSGLPTGAQVTVTCKGTGCAFKKKSVAAVNGKADLLKLFKKKSLKAGSRIVVTVTADGFAAKTFTFKTQAKKKPKLAIS